MQQCRMKMDADDTSSVKSEKQQQRHYDVTPLKQIITVLHSDEGKRQDMAKRI